MANLLTKIFRPPVVRGEGEYRPGPYWLPITGGWLPPGAPWNWWQSGYRPKQFEGGAMVEACVSAYAQTVATCPGTHWLSLPNGGRQRIVNSDLNRILHQPNDYQTISDLMLNLTRRLYLFGEAFGVVVRNNRGEVAELHLMPYGVASVATDGSIFYSMQGNEIAQARYDLSFPIPARDVLHVKLHTLPNHQLKGVSPILATAFEQQMAGAAMSHQVSYYLNEARPSFILETDQNLNGTIVAELRQRWNEQTQGQNAGGSPILTHGIKANPIVTNARDAQLVEMLNMTNQQIALAFRMPLQILGLGGTPFSSTEILMQSWISQGLGFCLNHIECAFDKLFKLVGQPDEYTEFDTEVLLRSAFKERIDGLSAGVLGGIFSSDEARAKLDLPATPGGVGSQPRVQQQVVPLSYGADMKAPDPNAQPAPPPKDAQPPPDQASANKRMLDYLRSANERARHAA